MRRKPLTGHYSNGIFSTPINNRMSKPTPKTISLEGRVTWKYCQDPATRKWVAACDPFQITIQAETFSALRQSMTESLDTMLAELLDTGDLERFLEEHGWTSVSPLPRRRAGRLAFDVPVNTRRVSARDLETALH